MPRGVATARGGRLDGGSSRLDLAARRTSLMELHRLNFLAAAVRTAPEPISPVGNPCCNTSFENRRSPKPWVGDATALQSKQQTG